MKKKFEPKRTRVQRKADRAFVIGLIWSAWWLSKMHGEDTYAMDLLRESLTDLEYVRRVAQKEQYHFRRGFWPELMEKRRRQRG